MDDGLWTMDRGRWSVRQSLLAILMLCAGSGFAQLQVPPADLPPPSIVHRPTTNFFGRRSAGANFPEPARDIPHLREALVSTKPHLAFFCRLEINEARGNAIPVKFRLGGHRSWQDDLLRSGL